MLERRRQWRDFCVSAATADSAAATGWEGGYTRVSEPVTRTQTENVRDDLWHGESCPQQAGGGVAEAGQGEQCGDTGRSVSLTGGSDAGVTVPSEMTLFLTFLRLTQKYHGAEGKRRCQCEYVP